MNDDLWVGEWRVSPDLNQIARGDVVTRLEPKAMALLLYLARRPQQVASREELLAAAWPGLGVGDNALTQVVIKLRKALGDTAREPTYVQSIAKKGYRLIAEVRRSAPPEHDRDRSAPAAELASTPPTPARPAARWAAAALAVAALVGSAAWIAHTPRVAAPVPGDAGARDEEF